MPPERAAPSDTLFAAHERVRTVQAALLKAARAIAEGASMDLAELRGLVQAERFQTRLLAALTQSETA